MSIRDNFMIGRGESKDIEYLIVADMVGRTLTIRNDKDEVVAQVAKTTKAMIKTAALGSGSESTIDIAPGVDVSTILAIVYGIGQVGHHYAKDAFQVRLGKSRFALPPDLYANFIISRVFQSYVAEPLTESLTGAAIETAGLGGLAQSYTATANDATKHAHKLERTAKFFKNTFFT